MTKNVIRSVSEANDNATIYIPKTANADNLAYKRISQESTLPPFIVEDRLMLSRTSADRYRITHTIKPGSREQGCLTCCYSPDQCPFCVYLGCGGCFGADSGCGCDYPEYAVKQMNASAYVVVRENSLEWNDPVLRYKACCSNRLEVMDRVSVMYFDDSQFVELRRRKRWCNLFTNFCFGGRGEQLLIEKSCCFGMCLLGRRNCCFLAPSCLGDLICIRGCVARRSIWVEDSEAAKRIITEARDNAKTRMKL